MRTDELLARGIVASRKCRYGDMRFLRTDVYMAQCLGWYGEFSESEIALWRHFVRPGDTVVSAGANCGAHVLWFSQHVGPAGRVITAEPQRVMFDVLMDNLEANGAANVEVHNGAIGAHAGLAQMPDIQVDWPFNFGSIGLRDLPGSSAEVEVKTIDELVAGRDVRLIHLDVEGHESKALVGAMETIKRCRPYLYVEIDRTEDAKGTLGMMAMLGYEVLRHDAPLFNPDNFAGQSLNVIGNTVSINALGVPK
jgi:FkbM family methyltransferase